MYIDVHPDEKGKLCVLTHSHVMMNERATIQTWPAMARTMASTSIAKTEKAGACKSLVDFGLWFGKNLRVQL